MKAGNIENATNIVWFVEEFYNFTSTEDVTQSLLIPQGFAASYNVPYNLTLAAISNDTTNYTSDPRAILFGKYAPNIETIEDMRFVMRLNNYSDTSNWCQAISSRCDLSSNRTFPFGAIDSKVTANFLIDDQSAWIIAGPTTELGIVPFSWSNWTKFTNESLGLPMSYNFGWQFITPYNFSTSNIINI